MKKMTREWIGKAEDDHRTANALVGLRDSYHDQICFHCQQSAEKYLKALMEELGMRVPRTHDLETLFTSLITTYPSLRSYRRGLAFLSNFAVGSRYPLLHCTKRQAVAALRWEAKVREACRDLLGIRSKRRP